MADRSTGVFPGDGKTRGANNAPRIRFHNLIDISDLPIPVAELPELPRPPDCRTTLGNGSSLGEGPRCSPPALVPQRNVVGRVIMLDDDRMVDRDITCALVEITDGVSSRLHHVAKKRVSERNCARRIVDEACLNVGPALRELAALCRLERADVELCDALLACGEIGLGLRAVALASTARSYSGPNWSRRCPTGLRDHRIAPIISKATMMVPRTIQAVGVIVLLLPRGQREQRTTGGVGASNLALVARPLIKGLHPFRTLQTHRRLRRIELPTPLEPNDG